MELPPHEKILEFLVKILTIFAVLFPIFFGIWIFVFGFLSIFFGKGDTSLQMFYSIIASLISAGIGIFAILLIKHWIRRKKPKKPFN